MIDSNSQQENKEEEVRGEVEELNFEKPDFVFLPKDNHEWRQQGPYLCCKSCEVEHAVWIGVEKMLVGLDEKGQPILKTRKELGLT